MALDTTSLLLAGVPLLVGLALLYQVIADRRRREGLVAMAARRGWSLEMEDRLTLAGIIHLTGRENRIRVAPRDGAAWRCEATNWDEGRENPDPDSNAELVARKGVTNFLDPSCPAPAASVSRSACAKRPMRPRRPDARPACPTASASMHPTACRRA